MALSPIRASGWRGGLVCPHTSGASVTTAVRHALQFCRHHSPRFHLLRVYAKAQDLVPMVRESYQREALILPEGLSLFTGIGKILTDRAVQNSNLPYTLLD